jgi:hypothetical protein
MGPPMDRLSANSSGSNLDLSGLADGCAKT